MVYRTNGKLDKGDLTWVVEYNGKILIAKNAVDNFELYNWCGDGHHRIWLESRANDGKPVSNILEWQQSVSEIETDDEVILKSVENTKYINAYKITEQDGNVTRTEGEYENDNLQWVTYINGKEFSDIGAEHSKGYRPYTQDIGMPYGYGTYEVWLKAFIDGGYKRVSNKVSWEVLPQEPTPEEKQRAQNKARLKVFAQSIAPEYEVKCGFYIDPDHNGVNERCIYCAGTDKAGNEVQVIYLDNNDITKFSSGSYENGYLYIWCDEASGKDYIVRCIEDENGNITASDCITNEIIYTITDGKLTLFGQSAEPSDTTEKGKFYFAPDTPRNSDRFYISENGIVRYDG